MTTTLIAVLIALGLMAMGFWQKLMWMVIGAGGIWMVIGAFAMTNNVEGEFDWFMGIIYIGVGFICLLSFFWLKVKKGDEEPEGDIDDEELEDYRKHMKELRGKGRQT